MENLWTIADWIGRVGFVTLFVMWGIDHLTKYKAMTAYAQSKRVPLAGVYVAMTGLMMLAGSVMVFLHWHPIRGAGLLILFLVPTAFLMHNFWVETDPMKRANEKAHFLKNLTIASAALLYAVQIHLNVVGSSR